MTAIVTPTESTSAFMVLVRISGRTQIPGRLMRPPKVNGGIGSKTAEGGWAVGHVRHARAAKLTHKLRHGHGTHEKNLTVFYSLFVSCEHEHIHMQPRISAQRGESATGDGGRHTSWQSGCHILTIPKCPYETGNIFRHACAWHLNEKLNGLCHTYAPLQCV